MDGLKNYVVRLGSLELATVIFWMLFWLANGLAKLIPGVHIGVKFAPKGEMNPFAATLDKMGWGTGLGDFRVLLHRRCGVASRADLHLGIDPVHHAERFKRSPSVDPLWIVRQRDNLRGVYVRQRGNCGSSDASDLAHDILRDRWRLVVGDRRSRSLG